MNKPERDWAGEILELLCRYRVAQLARLQGRLMWLAGQIEQAARSNQREQMRDFERKAASVIADVELAVQSLPAPELVKQEMSSGRWLM